VPTKARKAINKVGTSAPERTATKLAATLTNGPALLGYARVSTSDQDTQIQQAKLRDAGCAVIRAENASGKGRDGRSELKGIMSFVRPGDTLVVVKLDRMGKRVLTVLGMVAEMELSFIKDRQRAGIEAAKARGVYKGRPVTFDHALSSRVKATLIVSTSPLSKLCRRSPACNPQPGRSP
jgi:DNA invertase Pin-like site-specific DNA recombinase